MIVLRRSGEGLFNTLGSCPRPVSSPVSDMSNGGEHRPLVIGVRVAGVDHDQVLGLLHQAGKDGAEVDVELRRLLPRTTKAEYEQDDVAASVATKACSARARRHAASACDGFASTSPPTVAVRQHAGVDE